MAAYNLLCQIYDNYTQLQVIHNSHRTTKESPEGQRVEPIHHRSSLPRKLRCMCHCPSWRLDRSSGLLRMCNPQLLQRRKVRFGCSRCNSPPGCRHKGPHRRRRHRRQHPLCNFRHIPLWRRAGCRRSHSRLQGCQHIRTRRSTWTIANAARVERTHAVIHVVADAICIDVFSAIAAANAQSVFLVAVAVAVAAGMSEHPHS